jgi:hypothetical protein
VKKIKAAKLELEKYQKKVKCTSMCLMVLGAMGLVGSMYCSFNAMGHARHLLHKGDRPHHGGHGGHDGHHGKYGDHPRGPPPPSEDFEDHIPEQDEYVSKDMFELYDTIKTLSCISIFLMAKMIALGKCGKRMVWRNNSDATKWLQKKSYFGLILIILTGIWASSYGMHIVKIVERARRNHHPHNET